MKVETKCHSCGQWYDVNTNAHCSCINYPTPVATEVPPQWGDPEAEKAMGKAFEYAISIWKDRHQKYGRSNISRTGDVGCYVRIEDKIARLSRWYQDGIRTEFTDESLTDTWIDIINYAAMGLLCCRKEWPE